MYFLGVLKHAVDCHVGPPLRAKARVYNYRCKPTFRPVNEVILRESHFARKAAHCGPLQFSTFIHLGHRILNVADLARWRLRKPR